METLLRPAITQSSAIPRPITGQYSGHVICRNQSKASIILSPLMSPTSDDHPSSARNCSHVTLGSGPRVRTGGGKFELGKSGQGPLETEAASCQLLERGSERVA